MCGSRMYCFGKGRYTSIFIADFSAHTASSDHCNFLLVESGTEMSSREYGNDINEMGENRMIFRI